MERKTSLKYRKKQNCLRKKLDDLKTFEQKIPKDKYQHAHSTIVSLFTIKENFESIKKHMLNGDFLRWNHNFSVIRIKSVASALLKWS